MEFTWNKKFIELEASCINQWYTHLGNTFLKMLLLKVCETILFRQGRKVCSYTMLFGVYRELFVGSYDMSIL